MAAVPLAPACPPEAPGRRRCFKGRSGVGARSPSIRGIGRRPAAAAPIKRDRGDDENDINRNPHAVWIAAQASSVKFWDESVLSPHGRRHRPARRTTSGSAAAPWRRVSRLERAVAVAQYRPAASRQPGYRLRRLPVRKQNPSPQEAGVPFIAFFATVLYRCVFDPSVSNDHVSGRVPIAFLGIRRVEAIAVVIGVGLRQLDAARR